MYSEKRKNRIIAISIFLILIIMFWLNVVFSNEYKINNPFLGSSDTVDTANPKNNIYGFNLGILM